MLFYCHIMYHSITLNMAWGRYVCVSCTYPLLIFTYGLLYICPLHGYNAKWKIQYILCIKHKSIVHLKYRANTHLFDQNLHLAFLCFQLVNQITSLSIRAQRYWFWLFEKPLETQASAAKKSVAILIINIFIADFYSRRALNQSDKITSSVDPQSLKFSC